MKKLSRSRIIPIQPVAMQTGTATPADDVFALHPKRDKIYSRAVVGLFARLRWVMVWVTQLVFYGIKLQR